MRRVVVPEPGEAEPSPGGSTDSLTPGDAFVPSPAPESPAAGSKKKLPSAAEAEALLAELTAEERGQCEPGLASRYLRACGGDRQHALRRVRETLAWREKERPAATVCTACQAAPDSHYMVRQGGESRWPPRAVCVEKERTHSLNPRVARRLCRNKHHARL